MLRVCVSLMFMLTLPACLLQEAQEAANAPKQPVNTANENILACTGLPAAGQKCGLALPKTILPQGATWPPGN
jgi:hypothetical protein